MSVLVQLMVSAQALGPFYPGLSGIFVTETGTIGLSGAGPLVYGNTIEADVSWDHHSVGPSKHWWRLRIDIAAYRFRVFACEVMLNARRDASRTANLVRRRSKGNRNVTRLTLQDCAERTRRRYHTIGGSTFGLGRDRTSCRVPAMITVLRLSGLQLERASEQEGRQARRLAMDQDDDARSSVDRIRKH